MASRMVDINNIRNNAYIPYILIILSIAVRTAISPDWVYTMRGLDSWIYMGYFVEYPKYVHDFPSLYNSSRLSWILPGYLFHKLLPLEWAAPVLHVLVLTVSSSALYAIIARFAARSTAFLLTLLFITNDFVLLAAGGNYIDGPVIVYSLLSLLSLHRSIEKGQPVFMMLSGVGYFLAVCANPFAGILGVAHAYVYFLTQKPGIWKTVIDAVWFIIGMAATFAVLGAINEAMGGGFNFLHGTLTTLSDKNLNRFREPFASYLPSARWLILPAVASAAGLVSIVAGGWNLARIPLAYTAAILTLFILYIAWSLNTTFDYPVLQLYFYANFLLPVTFITLAAFVSGSDRREPTLRHVGLVLALIMLTMFPASPFNMNLGLTILLFSMMLPYITKTMSGSFPVSILIVIIYVNFMFSANSKFDPKKRIETKPQEYASVVFQSFAYIKESSGRQRVRLWYNEDFNQSVETVLGSLASMFLFEYNLISRSFPDVHMKNEIWDRHIDQLLPTLEIGEYIAVISNKDHAETLAVDKLKEFGKHLELRGTERIQSSLYSFNIFMMQVAHPREALAAPYADPPLINLSMTDEALIHAAYSDNGPDRKGVVRKLFEQSAQGFVMTAQTLHDHLVTPFVAPPPRTGPVWMRVAVVYGQAPPPKQSAMLHVQDQSGKIWFRSHAFIADSPQDVAPYRVQHFVRLDPEVTSLRLFLTAVEGGVTYLPQNLTVHVAKKEGSPAPLEGTSPPADAASTASATQVGDRR